MRLRRWTFAEFAVSAIPILVSGILPVLLWLTTEQRFRGGVWLPSTLLGKLVLQFAIIGLALLAHWIFQSRAITREERRQLQADLGEFLDKAVRMKCLDPEGDLDARMNVMTPQWRLRHLLEAAGAVRIGPLCAHTELPLSATRTHRSAWRLYVFACTQNMRHSRAAGRAWRKGVGLVGRHWATGDNIGFAVLPGDEAENTRMHQQEWNMDDAEARAHRKTRCVISLQMYDQLGPEQRVLGYLNVSGPSAQAVQTWIEDNDIKPEVAGALQALAERITEETSIVRLHRSLLV